MLYLDTSAFLKLLVDEEYSDELNVAIANDELWSSTLLAVEAHRAAIRLAIPATDVDTLLNEVSLVIPSEATFRSAQLIGGPELRTLDALHLAAATEIGPELESIVTYDRRLASAAAEAGVAVSSPGRTPRWWETD